MWRRSFFLVEIIQNWPSEENAGKQRKGESDRACAKLRPAEKRNERSLAGGDVSNGAEKLQLRRSLTISDVTDEVSSDELRPRKWSERSLAVDDVIRLKFKLRSDLLTNSYSALTTTAQPSKTHGSQVCLSRQLVSKSKENSIVKLFSHSTRR